MKFKTIMKKKKRKSLPRRLTLRTSLGCKFRQASRLLGLLRRQSTSINSNKIRKAKIIKG